MPSCWALPPAAVVDAAAGDDGHVRALADVEIVVHQIGQAGLAQDNGNVHALVFGERADVNVDAGLVVLGHDVMLAVVLRPCQLALARML